MAAPEARHPRRDHGAFHVRRADPRRTARRPRSEDGEEFFDEDDAATVATIKELLETRVRPAVARRRRRHHLPRLQGRHRLSRHEGRLLGLPVLDRDAEARHPEPAAPLPAGRARGSGRLRPGPARRIRLREAARRAALRIGPRPACVVRASPNSPDFPMRALAISSRVRLGSKGPGSPVAAALGIAG